MRIKSDKGCVNMICLSHNGKNIHFKCSTKPLEQLNGLYFKESIMSKIEFDDLEEVDSMIELLEIFKKECKKYIGEWAFDSF